MKYFLFIILMILPVLSSGQSSNKALPIIPQPATVILNKGTCLITSAVPVYYTSSDLKPTAEFISDVLQGFNGKGSKVNPILEASSPKKKKAIQLSIDKSITADEGYTLTIGENVLIAGKTAQGVFYGIQSLIQMLYAYQTPSGFNLPCAVIQDSPRFPWRGMHLDVSRHFFSKEFIKKYIDLLALHKMNVFHWHLVDDQGWRIEIKKYPRLTEVGAWRVDHEDLPWNNRPSQQPGEKAAYGGFYTQDDIKEVVAYAAQRFVNVVPEIEMPAHVTCAIAAYPQLSCKQTPVTVPSGGFWPITDIYCAGNDSTFLFLQDVLNEVMTLFPSKYIHIGGDEADKTNWKTCPKCQARMQAEGLQNVHELQNYFISRIDKYLTSKGRITIGWDEILEGGLAENATVMSWRGVAGGIQAARMKHDVVMTPTQYCYFDYYQSANKEIEPPAFGGLVDFKSVYSFEPVPSELSPEEAKHILGAQGNMWSEFLTTEKHTEYMALPRLTALSEVLWTTADKRDERSFLNRLNNLYTIYQKLDYNYHVPAPAGLIDTMIFIEAAQVKLENSLPFGTLRYTTDGSLPTSGSMIYREPLQFSSTTTIKAAVFLDNGKSSQAKTGILLSRTPEPPVQVSGQPEHGIAFNFYEGSVNSVTGITSLPLKKSGTISKVMIPEGCNAETMGLIFNGLIQVPETAVYNFKLISDDGSQLFIDGKLVVNHDGPHGPEPREGQIALQKGFHQIEVKYFEGGGGETLQLYMKYNNEPEKEVDADDLFLKN